MKRPRYQQKMLKASMCFLQNGTDHLSKGTISDSVFEGATSLARLSGERLVSLRVPSDRGQGRGLRATAGIAGSLAGELNLGLEPG